VTLAREMILDGRMPSPQQAHDARLATQQERARRREKRNQQPAQIRKREKRRRMNKAQNAAFRAQWEAERLDKAQPPIEEALAVVFDFTDPELWKSNSWAVLRPRLIVHQCAVIARLESELTYTSDWAGKQPFSMAHRDKAQRQRQREQRQQQGSEKARLIQQKLDRARGILRALEET
jgi:hypothetical protein